MNWRFSLLIYVELRKWSLWSKTSITSLKLFWRMIMKQKKSLTTWSSVALIFFQCRLYFCYIEGTPWPNDRCIKSLTNFIVRFFCLDSSLQFVPHQLKKVLEGSNFVHVFGRIWFLVDSISKLWSFYSFCNYYQDLHFPMEHLFCNIFAQKILCSTWT